MPLIKHSISGLSVGEASSHVTIYGTSTSHVTVHGTSTSTIYGTAALTLLKKSQPAFAPIFLYILNTTSGA